MCTSFMHCEEGRGGEGRGGEGRGGEERRGEGRGGGVPVWYNVVCRCKEYYTDLLGVDVLQREANCGREGRQHPAYIEAELRYCGNQHSSHNGHKRQVHLRATINIFAF